MGSHTYIGSVLRANSILTGDFCQGFSAILSFLLGFPQYLDLLIYTKGERTDVVTTLNGFTLLLVELFEHFHRGKPAEKQFNSMSFTFSLVEGSGGCNWEDLR